MEPPTKQELYYALDELVVQAMIRADVGSGRERFLKTGLLDPALRVLARGRASKEWKNGTLSVYDAMQVRGFIGLASGER